MDIENPEVWSTSFNDFFALFEAFFQRSETRESVRGYLRGLLADVKRKNSWQLAEVLGHDNPHPIQRMLNEALWDADEVCHHLRQIIIKEIGFEPGIGVLDESGFEKWGQKSAGVARQYCGRLGKVDNCQVGVFLAYVTPTGAAFLDRQLYLPQTWCQDRDRCRAAKIPDEISFQTKPQIACIMLERAWDEGVPLQWVVGDTLYGNSPELRSVIDQAEKYYVMALGNHHKVIGGDDGRQFALKNAAQALGKADWVSVCARMGEKSPIWYEWTRLRILMHNDDIGEQWLVVQRTMSDEPEHTFYLSNAPLETSLADLVGVALSRHSIEELLEEAKGEVGMADYEVRHWHGWHRHMTLVMMAHTWLKLMQHRERKKKFTSSMVELQFG